MEPYLEEAHPEALPAMARLLRGEAPTPAAAAPAEPDGRGADDEGRGTGADAVANPMTDWEATRYAATLGVSCEACHLGCRAHVESEGQVPPRFFPTSPHLAVE